MRFRFWSWAVSLVVEAPTWATARAWARVALQTTELQHEAAGKAPRDVRLAWRGSDYTGVMLLYVTERQEYAFTEWREARI